MATIRRSLVRAAGGCNRIPAARAARRAAACATIEHRVSKPHSGRRPTRRQRIRLDTSQVLTVKRVYIRDDPYLGCRGPAGTGFAESPPGTPNLLSWLERRHACFRQLTRRPLLCESSNAKP